MAINRVMVFADFYLPGFKAGGPIPSISRIIDLARECDFRVVTRNRDLGDKKPYPAYQYSHPVRVGRAEVQYISGIPATWFWMIREARKWRPETYYFNSVYSAFSTVLPLIMIRMRILPSAKHIMIAPRGELSQGALSLKRRKKALSKSFIKFLMGKKLIWHASSEAELNEIGRWLGDEESLRSRSVVAIDPPIQPGRCASQGSDKDVVFSFASRIDRKKGLERANRIIHMVGEEIPIVWHIHGTVTDSNYMREIADQLAVMPRNVKVSLSGSYTPELIQNIFADSTAFLFPTLGENFGHVIGEALSVGCPVFVTQTTPWTPLIEKIGGQIFDSDEEAAQMLIRLAAKSKQERYQQRIQIHLAYKEWFDAQRFNCNPFFEFSRALD